MERNLDGESNRDAEASAEAPAPCLGYVRAETLGCDQPPRGWRAVTATAVAGEGTGLFDDLTAHLLTFAAHRRAGIRVVADGHDIRLLDGPMRGGCRPLERTDESLRQSVVVGTLEGNRAVAEHRCHLEVDPTSGAVEVTVRTLWRPGAGYLLPGAVDREVRAFQRMADRVVRAVCSLGSD